MNDLSHVIAVVAVITSTAGLQTSLRALQMRCRTRLWVRAIEQELDHQAMVTLIRPDLELQS